MTAFQGRHKANLPKVETVVVILGKMQVLGVVELNFLFINHLQYTQLPPNVDVTGVNFLLDYNN